MEEIDVNQFISNVEMAGCLLLQDEKFEGERIVTIMSRNNNRRVLINATDETISKDLAIDYLFDLEMADLIDAFFPK